MRIILLANSWVGLKVCNFLKKEGEDIVALGIHEKERQRNTKEIIKTSRVKKNNIFTSRQLHSKRVLTCIKTLKPDLLIAAFWGYIIKPDLIKIPKRGCINFHPGYLPFNRGMNPNVWPIVEGTPAGVSLHYIDVGIDTGDVIARARVQIEPIDTAETLYKKTLHEIVGLFKKTWPRIKAGTNKRTPQKKLKGTTTTHKAADVNRLDIIDLDKRYKARDLINILRSRTYSDRFYAFYTEGGRRVYIRVQLSLKK